ncbi:primase-like DNA-binding domain-containing protein, partial [Neglectibacter timonensis]
NSSLSADIVICLSMVLLYLFWQYRAYFSVRYCLKFTESDRIRENREAVKRDNNNIFDFMESEGYIRRKADASISSKDFYEIYRMWCEENSLAPLKARSFSDAMIANARKFNLEHCNNITNSAGRRVWGFMGVEAIARPHINGFYGDSPCTYVPEDIPEEWRQVE